MSTFTKSLTVMDDLFGKDCTFSFATAKEGVPSVRVIDTYYHGEAFYIVTYANSQKGKEIEGNPSVALCNSFFRFTGKAYNLGHPLKPENAELRKTLIKVFAPWYFAHNNEDHEHMCFVKVTLDHGFCFKDGAGYKIDFAKKTAETFPFAPDSI